jgi:hypothetical protein
MHAVAFGRVPRRHPTRPLAVRPCDRRDSKNLAGQSPSLSRACCSGSPRAHYSWEGQVVNISRFAFRGTGAAFVAVWLANLAMTSLEFSSIEDLRDAAFEAKVIKHAAEGLGRCRSQSVRTEVTTSDGAISAQTDGRSTGKPHGRRTGNCTRISKCSNPCAKGRPIQASKPG